MTLARTEQDHISNDAIKKDKKTHRFAGLGETPRCASSYHKAIFVLYQLVNNYDIEQLANELWLQVRNLSR